jgi:hypothetical protein
MAHVQDLVPSPRTELAGKTTGKGAVVAVSLRRNLFIERSWLRSRRCAKFYRAGRIVMMTVLTSSAPCVLIVVTCSIRLVTPSASAT